jgi:hypothetical protein
VFPVFRSDRVEETATATLATESGAGADDALPLPGDTGATSHSWAIDWLAVTVWGVEADAVARLVSEAFHFGKSIGLSGWTSSGGAKFYGRRHEYLGTTVLSDCQSKGAEDNVHVELPGAACSVVGADPLLQLVERLHMWSSRHQVTRIDLAVDGCGLHRLMPTSRFWPVRPSPGSSGVGTASSATPDTHPTLRAMATPSTLGGGHLSDSCGSMTDGDQPESSCRQGGHTRIWWRRQWLTDAVTKWSWLVLWLRVSASSATSAPTTAFTAPEP